MKKVGMILEGGGERGVFTSGVLDYLMEQSFEVPYVIGVSAGTCNAVDYVSKQPYRTKTCMIDAQKDYDLYSAKNILHKGSYIDMELIFEEFPKTVYPFDFETYANSKTRCLMTTTNCLTGQAEYIEETEDKERMMAAARASSSLPFAASIVMIDGIPMLDGGIADSIPIQKATKDGYKYNIVVLTRPKGYKKPLKKSKTQVLVRAAYKKYPKVVEAVERRNRKYNKTLQIIEDLEKKGRVFVIRPESVDVGRAERNIEKLEILYQQGYDYMKEVYPEMLKWLERAKEV